MAMNYRIEIPGTKARRAASLRGARVAFGQMSGNVPAGTIGEITCDGDLVEQGVTTGFGWVSTADYPLETAIKVAAGDRIPVGR